MAATCSLPSPAGQRRKSLLIVGSITTKLQLTCMSPCSLKRSTRSVVLSFLSRKRFISTYICLEASGSNVPSTCLVQSIPIHRRSGLRHEGRAKSQEIGRKELDRAREDHPEPWRVPTYIWSGWKDRYHWWEGDSNRSFHSTRTQQSVGSLTSMRHLREGPVGSSRCLCKWGCSVCGIRPEWHLILL